MPSWREPGGWPALKAGGGPSPWPGRGRVSGMSRLPRCPNCAQGSHQVPDPLPNPGRQTGSRGRRDFPRRILFRGGRVVPRLLFLAVAFLIGCAGPQEARPEGLPLAWFRLKAHDARQVSVVGTFNGWDPRAHPLQGPDRDGVWSLALPLAPGRYRYVFVVDEGRWVTDPDALAYEDDGFGGSNALLVHGP